MFVISILPSAQADLESGFWFYEVQDERLGEYFLDCLTTDIESLRLFAGVHAKSVGGFYHAYPVDTQGTTCSGYGSSRADESSPA